MTRPKDAPVSNGAVSNDAAAKDAVAKNGASSNASPTSPSKDSAEVFTPARSGAAGTPDFAPSDRISRGLLLLVTAAAGAAVGTLGSFGHRTADTWLGVSWPVGLVLCLAGLVGLLLGLSELLVAGAPDSWRPTRLSALGCASAGWLLALLWITYLGPPPSLARKGDVVLANDARSLLYLLGGMLAVTVAVYRAWVATLSARLAGRPGASGSGHSKG